MKEKFALVGITYSFGADAGKGYLVVTDSIGNMLWSKVYGGDSGDSYYSFNDIVQTGDGFAVAGTTYSYGVGDQDIWLVKTNASGDMKWHETYWNGG